MDLGALWRLPCAGWARPEILQLLERQHYRPRTLPWPVRATRSADRKLHSQLANAQSWTPLEPSVPTWTRTGRATDIELGGRCRTRLGSQSGHGRIALSGSPPWRRD